MAHRRRTGVTINVASVNDAPVLSAIPDQTVYVGYTLNFTASASDPDLPNDTLTFSLTGIVPAGAAIDPVSGHFSLTPSLAQAGAIYVFGVRVTAAAGLYRNQMVTIGVAYEWSGVLAPLAGGDATVNSGSTASVKFRLSGAAASVTNATARSYYSRVINGVPEPELPAEPAGNSSTGNLFRYESGRYIFNWKTPKNLTPRLYLLRIDLGDGVLRTVAITIK